MPELQELSLKELQDLRQNWISSHRHLVTRMALAMVKGLDKKNISAPGYTNRVCYEDNITANNALLIRLKLTQGAELPYTSGDEFESITSWCFIADVETPERKWAMACRMHVHFSDKPVNSDFAQSVNDFFIPGKWVVALRERLAFAETIINNTVSQAEQIKRKQLLDLLSLSDKL